METINSIIQPIVMIALLLLMMSVRSGVACAIILIVLVLGVFSSGVSDEEAFIAIVLALLLFFGRNS